MKKTMKHNLKHALLCGAMLVMTCLHAWGAKVEIPNRPSPARLVNDMAGILNSDTQLEDSLEAFARTTSNQIVVVTVPDLGDYEPWEFASKLGDKWGVGQEKEDNGIIILIKPKTADSRGRVFIAPGKGLEGVLPDALCNSIISKEIIPPLRDENNNYDKAMWNALHVIMPIVKGEFDVEKYQNSDDELSIGELIFFTLLFFVIFGWNYFPSSKNKKSKRRGNSATWGGPGVGLGGWSSGGSSGGLGGFGGFGGGSFSGGGAGGSW